MDWEERRPKSRLLLGPNPLRAGGQDRAGEGWGEGEGEVTRERWEMEAS